MLRIAERDRLSDRRGGLKVSTPNATAGSLEQLVRRRRGLLPVDQWVKAARTDRFYQVMVEGCFEDAEQLARFLLQALDRRDQLLRQKSPNAAVSDGSKPFAPRPGSDKSVDNT